VERLPAAAGTVLATLLALCGPAARARAQAPPPQYVELRAAVSGDGDLYRYAEYTRTLPGGLVLDSVYIGVPGQNELYLGAGYGVHLTPSLTLTPLLYAVAGAENGELGLALGAFVSGTAGRWSIYSFTGYFVPLGGDVPRYFFVDSLDLARRLGKWELGLSTGHYVIAGEWSALAGPVLVRNDAAGAWKLYVRGGSAFEARLARTVTF
jgi:hypothetical protein